MAETAVVPGVSPDDAANPLTLVMTAKSPQDYAALRGLIEGLQAKPRDQNPVAAALTQIGTVHFAWFVFLDESRFAVITTYDGKFEDYILAFTEKIGDVFDKILEHIKDAPPLPVKQHPEEFLAYVQRNDLKCIPPFYSAYPNLPVSEIVAYQRNRDGA